MKILHTADWHIGRVLNGFSLLEDQQAMLNKLLDYLQEQRPDALVIAGDVYDRSVPPEDAVALLDSFLSNVVLDLKIPTLIIAGNHDGQERLGFGNAMLQQSGLHIAGRLPETHQPVILEDEHGPVCFHLLPYIQPKTAQSLFGDEGIRSHDDAVAAMVARALEQQPDDARSVVVAHAFVTGCSISDSERSLTVGGTGEVSADHFKSFDYAALGHLHAPQRAGSEHIRYSGSLLKYSFSEASHRKGFSLVHIGKDGFEKVEQIAFSPRREMRETRGALSDLLQADGSEDYLRVHLTDDKALLDPMGQLRAIFPNVMEIRRNWSPVATSSLSSGSGYADRTPLELFSDFYEQVTDAPLDDTQSAAFATAVEPLIQEAAGGEA